MKIYEDSTELPAGCRDKAPEWCFHALKKGHCGDHLNKVPGMVPTQCQGLGDSKEVSVRECCPMSCVERKNLELCKPSKVPGGSKRPVAILKAERDEPWEPEQEWSATVAKPGLVATDPRVLVGLMTMKTAGFQFRRRRRRNWGGFSDDMSPGKANAYSNYIFGSQANMWLSGAALLALVLCCAKLQDIHSPTSPPAGPGGSRHAGRTQVAMVDTESPEPLLEKSRPNSSNRLQFG